MNRVDLKELGVSITTPSLTIFMSLQFERRPVEKFHHLFGKAMAALKERYPDQMAGIVTDVQVLLSQVDLEQNFQSVALFINKYSARAYVLPFDLPDTIHVDKSFFIQPILNILNRVTFGWVIVIRHSVPYLFEAYEHSLLEVVHRHNGWQGERVEKMSDVGGQICEMPVERWGAQCRYATPQEFIAKIDAYLKHFLTGCSTDNGVAGHGNLAPLVLVAGQRDLDAFEQYSAYRDFAKLVPAQQNIFSQEELLKRAWPLISNYYGHWQRENLKELQEAVKAELVVKGVEAVWKAIRQDRVRLLCVERDLHLPACENLATTEVTPGTSCGNLRAIDAIDEILEIARSKGVRVSLYDHGELKAYDAIAAVLAD
jgi:hypothetical protein